MEASAAAAQDSGAPRNKKSTPLGSLMEVSISPEGASMTAEEQLIAVRPRIKRSQYRKLAFHSSNEGCQEC